MGYGAQWWPNPAPGLALFIAPLPMKAASILARIAADGFRARFTLAGRRGLVRAAMTRLAQVYRGDADELATRHSQSSRAEVGGVLPQPLATRQRHTQHARRQLHRRLFVGDLCEGRARHMGDAANRLSVARARFATL